MKKEQSHRNRRALLDRRSDAVQAGKPLARHLQSTTVSGKSHTVRQYKAKKLRPTPELLNSNIYL
jgi:hypothetical protein